MAITWKLNGKVTNIAEKRVSITGVRTDSSDPDNPKTFGPLAGSIETQEQRIAMLNQFKSLKTEAETNKVAMLTILDTIFASGETALNNWENK